MRFCRNYSQERCAFRTVQMNSSTEIEAGHPLFMELRNGLLWHRTSPEDFRRIQMDGAIKPNDGRINRWGQRYACQQLGATSLFDFTTAPEADVLFQAIKWQQFLGDFDPVTVLLGLGRNKLPGRLIPYPQNKEGTTGNVIPWVEVCHCGPIPLSAVTSYLLVCPVDYRRFEKLERVDENGLNGVEKEFERIVTAARQEAAALAVRQREAIRQRAGEVAAHKPTSAEHA